MEHRVDSIAGVGVIQRQHADLAAELALCKQHRAVLYATLKAIADDQALSCRCGEPPYIDGEQCPRCTAMYATDASGLADMTKGYAEVCAELARLRQAARALVQRASQQEHGFLGYVVIDKSWPEWAALKEATK